MMKKITIYAIILAFLFGSCTHITSYYPSVDTGKTAEMKKVYSNRKIDSIVYGNIILVSPESIDDNTVFHVSDNAKILEPVCNFGNKNQYTLYEVYSEVDFPVYVDSKNKIVFVEERFEDDLLNYYSDFNNYLFSAYIKGYKHQKNVEFEKDFINTLYEEYADIKNGNKLTEKDGTQIYLSPQSKDGLVEKTNILLYKVKDDYYWESDFYYVSKLKDDERIRMHECLENI